MSVYKMVAQRKDTQVVNTPPPDFRNANEF